MKYSIDFLKWHDVVEHVAFIKIDNIILEIFIPYCSVKILDQSQIFAHLEAEILDEYKVNLTHRDIGIYQIDQGLSYSLVGILQDGILTINHINFFDDVLLSQYYYLNGQKIEWKVDRIHLILDE